MEPKWTQQQPKIQAAVISDYFFTESLLETGTCQNINQFLPSDMSVCSFQK